VRLTLLILIFLISPVVIFSQNMSKQRIKVQQIIESAINSSRDGKFLTELNILSSIYKKPELFKELYGIEDFVFRIRIAERLFELGMISSTKTIMESLNSKNGVSEEVNPFFSQLKDMEKLLSSKDALTIDQASKIKQNIIGIFTKRETLKTLIFPDNNRLLSRLSSDFGPALGTKNYPYVLTTLGKSEDLKGNMHMATRNYYLAYGFDLVLNQTDLSASPVRYLSNHLINSGQIETFRAITKPILNYTKSSGLRYDPEYFNFLAQYWLNLLITGDFKNAVLVEKDVEKILEKYEIAPVEGLRSYIEAKWLSAIWIYKKDPKEISNSISNKYHKLVNLTEITKYENNFLLLFRILYRNITKTSVINKSELEYLINLSDILDKNSILHGMVNSLIAVFHRNDPDNAIRYLENSTRTLVNSWNSLLKGSYANQHKLNKYFETSIYININLIEYISNNFDISKFSGMYEILLTHTNILNSAETSIGIMNSSNNPDIYDRINKSRRLLYKTLNKEIIDLNNLNQKNINPPDNMVFNPIYWSNYKRLVDLLAYQNGILQMKARISDPIEKNVNRFIKNNFENSNKILFTISIIGNRALQTCYSNNRKYTRITPLDKNYKEKIKKLRTLTDPTLNPGNNFDFSLANTLYRNFFGLLDDCHLNGKILYMSIDPSLYNLPINALMTKPSTKFNNNFWFPLNFNYYILPFNNLIKKKFKKRNFTKYLGIGNPKYNSNINDFKIDSDTEDLIVTRNSEGLKLINLPPLPFTESEINNIKTLFKINKVLLKENATEKNFRETNFNDFDVIHFATHGLVTGDYNQLQPGLALADPLHNRSWYNDGYLSSEEIARLPLDGQIVILSACNTAVDSGAKYNFGLSELSNSFLEAGARMIVVTQWPIVSKTSSEFTYKFLSSFKKNESNALGKTINHFINNTKYSHPKYWAPFLKIGNHPTERLPNNHPTFYTVTNVKIGSDGSYDHQVFIDTMNGVKSVKKTIEGVIESNNKGTFLSSIDVNNNVFATISLDSKKRNGSKPEEKTLLLRLDQDGKVKLKKLIKGRDSKILGQYREKLYIYNNFYKYDANIKTFIFKTHIGEFNYNNNAFKTVFDIRSKASSLNNLFNKFKYPVSEQIVSGKIIKDHLYAFMSITGTDNRDDDTEYHYLLIINLTDYSKSIHQFPIFNPSSFTLSDFSSTFYFKAIFSPEYNLFDDIINIFVEASNVDLEGNQKRFMIHYNFSDGKLNKIKEYEKKSVAGYLPEDKLFYGLVHKSIDYKLHKNRFVGQKDDSDLAFFYLDDESLKIKKQFRFPSDQEVVKVIKMDDKFLLYGTNKTPLTWRFREKEYIEDNARIYSTDSMLVLMNDKLSYLDSKIFATRDYFEQYWFDQGIMSISRIDENRFMLFKDTPKLDISVNVINEFN
jgi:CHAT domain-containing protein